MDSEEAELHITPLGSRLGPASTLFPTNFDPKPPPRVSFAFW